ncbi:Inositol-tetrakisphosphate 1-kinase [Musa troglodytarum]|uniref:Inositol-tetrakisphosphate 1-kinase n=1 Tax=Musa troglodytarum TaxID=320322 RepID=A0A9E7JNN3_9LILI|nr:Inositol-tetrakisphosphate 1-kinase [Musa troglodytarum]
MRLCVLRWMIFWHILILNFMMMKRNSLILFMHFESGLHTRRDSTGVFCCRRSSRLPSTTAKVASPLRLTKAAIYPLPLSRAPHLSSPFLFYSLACEGICTIRMAKGLVWATTEDLARNRAKVLSLYRQILRSLNSPELLLTHAARLAKKAEVRSIFLFGAEERSLHNIADLIDAANYSLSILKQGRLP